MAEDLRSVCSAGRLVDEWLKQNQRSQRWLIAEINRRRQLRDLPATVAGANLWRWRVGGVQPSIDNAAVIEEITGVPAQAWAAGAADRVAAPAAA
jgi:hypothetical protein